MMTTLPGTRVLASLLALCLLAVPALATESESVAPQERTVPAPDVEKKNEAAPVEKKAGDDEAKSKVCRPSPARVNTLEELRAGDATRFGAALDPASAAAPVQQPATAKKEEKADSPGDDER